MARLAIEYWPLERLRPYERKLKRHRPEDVARLAALFWAYGFRDPLLVNEADGVIIDGDGLRLAAILSLSPEERRELGLEPVPVIPVGDLAPERVRGLRLALKRSATWAEFEDEALALEVRELAILDQDLCALGLDDRELEELLRFPPPRPAGDELPTAPEGDRHREQYGVIVLCRDEAHQKEVYEALLAQGHQCRVVVT